MRRRILAFLLAVVMALTSMSAAVFAEEETSEADYAEETEEPFLVQTALLAGDIIRSFGRARSGVVSLETGGKLYELAFGWTEEYDPQVMITGPDFSAGLEASSDGLYLNVEGKTYFLPVEELVEAFLGEKTEWFWWTYNLLRTERWESYPPSDMPDFLYRLIVSLTMNWRTVFNMFSGQGINFSGTDRGILLSIDPEKVKGAIQQQVMSWQNGLIGLKGAETTETIPGMLACTEPFYSALSGLLRGLGRITRENTGSPEEKSILAAAFSEPLTLHFSRNEIRLSEEARQWEYRLSGKAFGFFVDGRALRGAGSNRYEFEGKFTPSDVFSSDIPAFLLEGFFQEGNLSLKLLPQSEVPGFTQAMLNFSLDSYDRFQLSLVTDSFQICAAYDITLNNSIRFSCSDDAGMQISGEYKNGAVHIDAGQSYYSTGDWLRKKGAYLDLDLNGLEAGYRGNRITISGEPDPVGSDNRIDISAFGPQGGRLFEARINTMVQEQPRTNTESDSWRRFRHRITLVSGLGREKNIDLTEVLYDNRYQPAMDKIDARTMTAEGLIELLKPLASLLNQSRMDSNKEYIPEETTFAEYGTDEAETPESGQETEE